MCPMARLEATYLPWVDISAIGLGADALEERLMERAGVWVNSGVMYGADGYVRLNIACPRKLLEDALMRVTDIMASL